MASEIKRLDPDQSPGRAGDGPSVARHADALARLFESHNRSLKSFLMARIGDEQEVQEVVQEAYARLLQLHQPGAISFLRAYLFKTAAHIAVDRARQRHTRERIDQALMAQEDTESPSADRFILASEQLAIVEQALAELPPKYRRAFILRRYHEWAPEQIALELGTQLRMVRNYISRATVYCKLRMEGASPLEARAKVLS
jgi:RNA polymerase sigma-70 factor (ECF subfamily)